MAGDSPKRGSFKLTAAISTLTAGWLPKTGPNGLLLTPEATVIRSQLASGSCGLTQSKGDGQARYGSDSIQQQTSSPDVPLPLQSREWDTEHSLGVKPWPR
ncbi:hypothetical protein QQF64_008771 [Cirrhinus molitorella]|uniref:Uncharacterized protein n=1 Tax=Cirrhinus molitorella TaxID=172907 RepID=A0ABR3M746_9TELE